MQVELLEFVEDTLQPLGKDHLAIDESNAFLVDLPFMRLDLGSDELTDHFRYVAIESNRFVWVSEALAVLRREVAFGDPNQGFPVDAAAEVVLEVVVVFEEVTHRSHSSM